MSWRSSSIAGSSRKRLASIGVWIATLNNLMCWRFFITLSAGWLRCFRFFRCCIRSSAASYFTQRTSEPEHSGTTASLPWLDVYCARRSFLPRRCHNGDLHSDCWAMPVPSQGLLVRTGDRLHRMSLRSIRDDSRSLYNRCTFARVCERSILHHNFGSVGLKIFSGFSSPSRFQLFLKSSVVPRCSAFAAGVVLRHCFS